MIIKRSTGLVLYVKYNPVTKQFEDFSRNHHPVANTDVIPVRGKYGGAGIYNGATSFLNCGNDPSLNITDAITIEAWVKPISSGEAGYGRIMWKTTAITVFMKGAGSQDIMFITQVGGVDKTASSTGDAVSYNNWHHVVGVFDGINVLVYVDGIMFTGLATAGPIDDPSASNMYIGNVVGASRTFDGIIDEVRIYNRSLSAAEILSHYKSKGYWGPLVESPVTI